MQELIGGEIGPVGVAVAVFIGKGQYAAVALVAILPIAVVVSVHIGQVQHLVVVKGHEAAVVHIFRKEFDSKSGRQLDRAPGQAFNGHRFESQV